MYLSLLKRFTSRRRLYMWTTCSNVSRSTRRYVTGSWWFGGLRYPVEMLLELMSAGMAMDEILADYEDLEREDLLAVRSYATQLRG